MRRRDLALKQRHLRRVESLIPHVAKLNDEICTGDRADVSRDVAESRAESGNRPIEEVVTRVGGIAYTLNLVEGRVACPDDGDGTWRDGCAVVGGEVAGRAKRLQRFDDVREGCRAVRLHIHEQIEGLASRGIVDTVACGRCEKRTVRVLVGLVTLHTSIHLFTR